MRDMIRAVIIVLAPFVLLSSCGGKPGDEGKPIAKVNDFVISEDSCRREMAASAYFQPIPGLSYADKKRFVDTQIRKELLIQEATKSGLDKGEAFRQTIERYWEQTLISSLVEQKSKDLEKDILVTQEEIEGRYRALVQAKPDLEPLEELAPEIGKEIREQKKTKALESWMDGLWAEADIKIYEENLQALR
jgi:hypothetical protein